MALGRLSRDPGTINGQVDATESLSIYGVERELGNWNESSAISCWVGRLVKIVSENLYSGEFYFVPKHSTWIQLRSPNRADSSTIGRSCLWNEHFEISSSLRIELETCRNARGKPMDV